ncbi:hemolysin family protein [Paenibacillus sp. P25]|nr:hemolysin family protein [Paenibacillus sp. P25]
MKMILVCFFIACTAFFVAAEYAVIRSRASRIEQLAAEGSKKAANVKHIVSRLDEYLSACQLGNTLTNLALGWLGESTIEHLLHPLFSLLRIPASLETVLSFILAFLLLTFLEVVVGELVPKILAIHNPEPLALALAGPLMVFFKITYPFSWSLSRSAQAVTRLLGVKKGAGKDNGETEAELRLILSEGYKSGIINPYEFRYVTNIFELDEMVAKGIMIPRRDIVFVSQEDTVQDVLRLMKEAPYDRYPVTRGKDKDEVVGMLSAKEVFADYLHGRQDANRPIKPHVRPILQVIETVSAQEPLLMMQQEQIHMAVLLDEYGGTSGLLTIKDLIGKIVGEQRHRRDPEGLPMVQKIGDGHYLLSGKPLLSEVNQPLRTHVEDEGIYTLGGWMLTRKYEIRENDCIEEEQVQFIVKEMDHHQIKRVEAVVLQPDE